MNLITIPYSSEAFYIRPDTSLNRDSNDYFCPDGVDELVATVFIYAKAGKAGKSVASRFANRYYSIIGEGIHLSAPAIAKDNTPESWWVSNSLDSSTFLLGNEAPKEEWNSEIIQKIDEAFERTSKHISFRTGDYIIVELSEGESVKRGCSKFTYKEKQVNIIW